MLSSRARYALRALLELSLSAAGKPTLVQDIADRQNIPVKFLQQIMLELKQAGILSSRKGPGGGYLLARSPAEISVLDIVQGVEAASLELGCQNLDCGCQDRDGCVIDEVLEAASIELKKNLARQTLADLRNRHNERLSRKANLTDYSI